MACATYGVLKTLFLYLLKASLFYCFIYLFCRVEFSNGSKAVEKFRMIERHYFRDRLLKSFDFEFGFVMPNSTNSMEHIYEVPALAEEDGELVNIWVSYRPFSGISIPIVT